MTYVPGDTLKDRYLIKEKIGTGSMGEVYRAEHLTLHKQVAIKLMHLHIAEHPESLIRFKREAGVVANLDNPHICQVMDFDNTEHGDFYLVMEYLTGETLRHRLERQRKIEIHSVFRIMRDLLSALDTTHASKLVHRDVKPDNMMLQERDDRDDFVKLIDFGIAHTEVLPDDSQAHLTQMGAVYGTPQYLSPEQVLGEYVDHRADLYSCGCTLFEMLQGRPPFEATNYILLLNKHLTLDPPHLTVNVKFGRELDAIIQKLLRKAPEERFQTAREVREALNNIENPSIPSPSLNLRLKDDLERAAMLNETTRPSFPAVKPVVINKSAAETATLSGDEAKALAEVKAANAAAHVTVTFNGEEKKEAEASSATTTLNGTSTLNGEEKPEGLISGEPPIKLPFNAVGVAKGVFIVLLISALVSMVWQQKKNREAGGGAGVSVGTNTHLNEQPRDVATGNTQNDQNAEPEEMFVLTDELFKFYAKTECHVDDDKSLADDEEIRKAAAMCKAGDFEAVYDTFEKYKNKYADSTRFNIMRTIVTFATGKFKYGIDALTKVTQTEPEAMCIPVIRDINYALIEQDDIFDISMNVARNLVDPGNSTRAVAWLVLAHPCVNYKRVYERDLAMYDAIDIRDRDPAGEWLYQAVYMWRNGRTCDERQQKSWSFIVDYMKRRCDSADSEYRNRSVCTMCYPVFRDKLAELNGNKPELNGNKPNDEKK